MSPLSNLQNIKKTSLGVNKQFDLIIHNGRIDEYSSPGETIGPLIRDFYVIKYCSSGRGQIILNDVSYTINAGQCYVAMPGDVMTEIADVKDPWCQTWLTLYGTKASLYFNSIGISTKNPLFPWTANESFIKLLKNTIKICGDSCIVSELRRAAHAYHIFDWLTRRFTIQPTSIVNNYVDKAIYFMENNYSSDIKITDICAYLNLNRSYFFRIFKEKTHYSPQEYLIRLRMFKACELFSFPNATVASVANSLNCHPAVFFRHFKRIIGISPSEYKKKIWQQRLE